MTVGRSKRVRWIHVPAALAVAAAGFWIGKLLLPVAGEHVAGVALLVVVAVVVALGGWKLAVPIAVLLGVCELIFLSSLPANRLADFIAGFLLSAGVVIALGESLQRAVRQRTEMDAMYRTLVGNLPGCAVFVVDSDLRYRLAEGEAMRNAGIVREDLEGKTLFEALDRELVDKYEPYYRRALGGVPFEVEHAAHGRNFVSRGVPLCDESGKPHSALVVSYDITDRKLAERMVRESEQQARLALESARLGSWTYDFASGMTTADRRAREIAGVEHDRLLSRGEASTLVMDDDFAATEAAIAAALDPEGDGLFSVELRLQRSDGTVHWAHSYGRVEFAGTSANRQPVKLVGTLLDLTAWHEAKESRRLSEENFRLLADHIPQLAWMADETGSIVWYNQRWFDVTGTKLDQMKGWGWQRVHHPAHVERVTDKFKRHIENGEVWEDTFPLRNADGSYRWYLSRAFPVRNSDGRITRWFGTNTDITDRRDSEQAIQNAREEAERANRAKDEFLAVLSHELRTPLTPVSMILDRLAADQNLVPDLQRQVQTMQRNVALETRLIDDLLDLTRIVRGKLIIRQDCVDVHEILRHSTEVCVDETFQRRRLQFLFDLQATQAVVQGDEARLGQVFWNVIKNAAKFSFEGGNIDIISRNPDANTLEISIIDHGKGIDAQALEAVFSAFERSAQTARQFGGLGLGLSISKAIMEAHGGSIRAESAGENRGARFVLTFRLNPVPEVEPGQEKKPGPARPLDARLPLQGITIAYVEDHADTASVLSLLLKEAGADVYHATSVEGGLKILTTEDVDFLLSDLGLPDGHGSDLMRAAQRLTAGKLPGVALSGYGMEGDISRSRAAGFAEHLIKPIDFGGLVRLIRQLTQQPVPPA